MSGLAILGAAPLLPFAASRAWLSPHVRDTRGPSTRIAWRCSSGRDGAGLAWPLHATRDAELADRIASLFGVLRA